MKLQVLRNMITLGVASIAFSAGAQTSPFLSGSFVYLGSGANSESLAVAQIPLFFDELQVLGTDTIVTTETRAKRAGSGCGYSAGAFEWVKGLPDKIGMILDAAHARGMKVYIGTPVSSAQCSTFWGVDNTRSVVEDIRNNLSVLSSQYGGHPAFAGWYIPDETGTLGTQVHPYFKQVVAALDGLTPGKSVAIAPYYFSQLPPHELGLAAARFRDATGVDLQIWQDSVGAAPEAKLYHWSRSGYSTEQYYEALSSALGASGLWADVELFNYGKPLFNKPAGVLTGGYRPTSMSRLNQQLWSARFAGKRISWLHQWHMSEVTGPANGYVEAPWLQAAYRGRYGIGSAKWLAPLNLASYTWGATPSSSYPDSSGYELFDRRTGDPRNPYDPAWIGIDGVNKTASFKVDLSTAKRVDWIGVHTLSYPIWGIRGVTTADVYCGATSSALSKIGTISAPFTQQDLSSTSEEEYVIANRSPFGADCRFVELRIPTNSNWVFISEVEMTTD